MMSPPRREIHLRLDIRGAINNFKKSEWKNVVRDDDGTYLSPSDVKSYFLDCLSEGKKYLPFGTPCVGWSYETGCPGHELPLEKL